jgi:hypothetical protein
MCRARACSQLPFPADRADLRSDLRVRAALTDGHHPHLRERRVLPPACGIPEHRSVGGSIRNVQLEPASVWNTNASISIPVPAITQAISAPKTPVARAKLRGREKTPAPTIDPTTIAISVVSGNVRTSAGAFVSTDATRPPPVLRRAHRQKATRHHDHADIREIHTRSPVIGDSSKNADD